LSTPPTNDGHAKEDRAKGRRRGRRRRGSGYSGVHGSLAWSINVDIVDWRFYPALIGPSVDVNWLAPGPDRRLT